MSMAQFLETAVSLSIQVAFVAVATDWLSWLVRSEISRCRLWVTCFVIILLLTLAAALLPHPRLFHPWSGVGSHVGATVATGSQWLGFVLLLVWLSGAAISLGLFLIRSFRMARFLGACEAIDDLVWLRGRVEEHLRNRGGNRSTKRVVLLSSKHLTIPFCWQFHRPYIVLPESLLAGGRQETFLVVRHELEHLRTGHPLHLFLQRMVEILFWFHPVVWWASHRMALTREFVCDAAAVDSSSDVAAYLRTLLKIAECDKGQRPHCPVGLPFGGSKSIVAQRVSRLVRVAEEGATDHRRQAVGARAAGMGLAVAGVLAAFVWLPVDVLASPGSKWSPWPSWTARVLHDAGISARDFERYDPRFELHELIDEGTVGDDDRH